jgi:hypothetical protein
VSKSDSWPAGDCFANATKYALAMEDPAGVVVAHGHVNRPLGLPPIKQHAWVQRAGNVIDPTIDIVESKANLRQQGIVYVAERCYTPDRALRLSLRHGHWGPFTARERKAVPR